MILAIDIGNSNIVLGGLDGDDIIFSERTSTDTSKTELEYAVLINAVLNLNSIDREQVTGCIISSVVPSLVHIVKTAVKKLLNISSMVVGAGLKTGLNIKLDDPRSLGADLVVDSVASLHVYGAPTITIDMGTATTVTVIDKSKSYIGGVILPGIRISLESLSMGAALLPHVALTKPERVISTDTTDAIKGGILYGQAGQIDGFIDRFEAELGYHCTTIATGGLAKLIIPHCHHDIILDNDLMLKGLKIIYDKNA